MRGFFPVGFLDWKLKGWKFGTHGNHWVVKEMNMQCDGTKKQKVLASTQNSLNSCRLSPKKNSSINYSYHELFQQFAVPLSHLFPPFRWTSPRAKSLAERLLRQHQSSIARPRHRGTRWIPHHKPPETTTELRSATWCHQQIHFPQKEQVNTGRISDPKSGMQSYNPHIFLIFLNAFWPISKKNAKQDTKPTILSVTPTCATATNETIPTVPLGCPTNSSNNGAWKASSEAPHV